MRSLILGTGDGTKLKKAAKMSCSTEVLTWSTYVNIIGFHQDEKDRLQNTVVRGGSSLTEGCGNGGGV